MRKRPKCSGTRSRGAVGGRTMFSASTEPLFLTWFCTQKVKMPINSRGALEPRSEPRQDINGCCLYSVLWCCLYLTGCASASSGLNELGFNSPWSDSSPTLSYLIVVMIICVLKTAMTPCCSLFDRDTWWSQLSDTSLWWRALGNTNKYVKCAEVRKTPLNLK